MEPVEGESRGDITSAMLRVPGGCCGDGQGAGNARKVQGRAETTLQGTKAIAA